MRWLSFLGLLLTAQVAHAEDCSSVIALSKISSSTISSKNSFEQAADRYCNEYASAKSQGKSMNAGGSYGAVSASFGQSSSSSEAVASKICSANDNSKKSDNAYEEYVNQIAPGAYGAYEQCLALSNSDIKFSVDEAAILPRQLVMTVNYTSQQGAVAQPAHLTFFASDGVTCKWSAGTSASIAVQSPQNVSLACSRQAANSKAFITVTRTDGGSKIALPWPAYNAEGVKIDTLASLTQQVSALIEALATVRTTAGSSTAAIAALDTDLRGEKAKLSYTIVPQGAACPSGWSRMGMIGFIVNNPDYASANMGQGGAFNDGWTWTHPTLCRRS